MTERPTNREDHILRGKNTVLRVPQNGVVMCVFHMKQSQASSYLVILCTAPKQPGQAVEPLSPQQCMQEALLPQEPSAMAFTAYLNCKHLS